jgi:peptide/nickel transport system ATP-binding protein
MTEEDSMLRVEGLKVTYRSKGRRVRAVGGVSFDVAPGEVLGLVGESGCGKSTVAMSLLGLLPTNAEVEADCLQYRGRDLGSATEREWRDVRWQEIAMVFQGGMNALNPLVRIVDQITEPMHAHEPDVDDKQAHARAIELLIQVGISERRAGAYPHELSGGMRQRAGIAMALACRPHLIIADEPVTALDVVIQAQILELLSALKDQYGLGMVFISHDLGVVARVCDRVAVMYAGEIVEEGPADEMFRDPKHPYTRGLVACTPVIGGERGVGAGLPGAPPAMWAPPPGCRFHPRCPSVMERCRTEPPEAVQFDIGRLARCHLYD